MSWESVACCDDCWWGEERDGVLYPNGRGVTDEGMRLPVRMIQEMRSEEFCHLCGWTTYSGIYVRVNTNDQPAIGLRIRKEGI